MPIDVDHMFDHLRSVWSSLASSKIFITGGTGFFGTWMVESLLDANRRLELGIDVYLLTRDPSKWSKQFAHLAEDVSVKIIPGDVRTVADSLLELLPKNLDYIVHAAFDSGKLPNTHSPRTVLETLLTGAIQVLRIAEITNVKRLMYVSSGAVYGPQPPTISHLPENYLGGPDLASLKSAYGEGKRAAELLAISHAADNDYECVIARGFGFVGPYLPLDVHFAVGNFLRNFLDGKDIVVQGDGTPLRSYLYAADMAIWLWKILMNGRSGIAYNLGSPVPISISNLAKTIAEFEQPNKKVSILTSLDKNRIQEQYVPDVSRAKDDLGLEVFIPFHEALRRTLEFYRQGMDKTEHL